MNAPLATTRSPTPPEEIVHAFTHGIGLVLALAALRSLVIGAAARGIMSTASAAAFGTSLVLVYLASTLYHAVPARMVRAKAALRILDHVAIHLLIAGTYTPLALCAIGGVWGWTLIGVVWALVVVGVIVETTALRHSSRLSVALYLGSGWIGLLALPLLWTSLPQGAFALLILGGVVYTAGVPFFLAHRTRWMHALWHGFVLAGSALHVAAIALVLAA
jgi:hemolysin III